MLQQEETIQIDTGREGIPMVSCIFGGPVSLMLSNGHKPS